MKSTKIGGFPAAVQSTSDLAKRLGLSRWTVSRILNGHEGVRPETAERVRKAMEEAGFFPNPLAQGLRRGRTNIVGICLPEIEGYYLGPKLEHLRESLAQAGYHVMVAMTNGEPREEAEALNRFRVLRTAGVILVASQLASRSQPVRQFCETGIPLVLVDPISAPPKGSLCVDRTTGMKQAIHHLFDLGHRHIAVIGLTGEGRYSKLRLKSIDAAYAERGWKAADLARQVPIHTGGTSHYQSGWDSAMATWRDGSDHAAAPRPTAALALNDRVAIGLIDGLRELGLRVPEDVSVIGYDNMEVSAFVTPKLTTIDCESDQLVEQTTARLLKLIQSPQKTPLPSIRIASRLVIRASTAAVSKSTPASQMPALRPSRRMKIDHL